MTSVAQSLEALGLEDEEKKRKPSSVDASMSALGLADAPVTAGGLGKAALSAIPKAIAGIAGTPAALDQLGKAGVSWLVEKMTGKPAPFPEGMPTPMGALLGPGATISPEYIREQMERVTGPLYEPQNRAEKYADTATQFAASLGRPNPKSIATALTAAGGTEGAGVLTGDHGGARFAGGMLAGGVPTAINAWKNAPAQAVRQAVGDIPPDQMNAALLKQAEAMRAGVPLMGAESMPNSGIQQLAADVNASRQGSPIMRQFLEQRPDQIRGAVGGMLGSVAPRRAPEEAAALAQQAATKTVGLAEDARTAAVSPLYRAAENQPIPSISSIEAAIAAQKGEYGLPAQQAALRAYEKAIANTPQTAGAYDKLYRSARDETSLADVGATSKDKLAATVLAPVRDELGAVTGANPNIAAGRDLYRQITERTNEPLAAGTVGRVAGVKTGGYDPSTTAPVQRIIGEIGNPQTARPETIRELHMALNAQDRTAFPAIARTYLENSFDQATQRVQAGDNRMMGANFAKAVVGTDQQRANFDEILRGVAKAHNVPPDQLVRGANVLIQTLEATGKVPGVGSPSAGRQELQQQLGQTVGGRALSSVSTSPLRWASEAYNHAVMGGRHKQLAEVLTAPDSVQQIIKMAKLKPDGMTARYYASQLFSATREAQ